ncbi:hypothetical protein [Alienimonas chondri]|uniref:Uncharacterized protein n=1 Tax=Alienimonas chondri TaxID=2681879 RepID=A0ABX1VGK0_9PLAN|nr:hypothetical protein [Alienimonas chondri]NNJ27224.1 hypothetical protein [Alienimonas chondri]
MSDLVTPAVSRLGVSEGRAEDGPGLLLEAAPEPLPKVDRRRAVPGEKSGDLKACRDAPLEVPPKDVL